LLVEKKGFNCGNNKRYESYSKQFSNIIVKMFSAYYEYLYAGIGRHTNYLSPSASDNLKLP
jgi:hypothetical protein